MKGKESITMAYYPVYIREDQIKDLRELKGKGFNPAHLIRLGIDSELEKKRKEGVIC